MWRFLLITATCISIQPAATTAQDAPVAPKEDEAAYARTLEKRVADILAELKLDDPAVAGRVRDKIVAQYKGLRALHDARDAKLRAIEPKDPGKSGRIEAERALAEVASSTLNDRFLAGLAEDLPADRVELVKDKMTYHKLQVTYNGYVEMLPKLTAKQKEVILVTLTQARDRAVYAGSAEEKTAIFDRFKGRVNNYLSGQGYDLKLAAKEWAERRKAAK